MKISSMILFVTTWLLSYSCGSNGGSGGILVSYGAGHSFQHRLSLKYLITTSVQRRN